MVFVRSYFFPNATLTSWTFLDHFCHHFWVGFLLLCCCTHQKVMTKMAKKCSTGQSCIRKEVTSYKIGTLVTKSLTDIQPFKIFEVYACKFHNPNYPHLVARYVIVHLPPALSSLLHAYSSTKLPDLMPLLLARGETLWDNEFSLV